MNGAGATVKFQTQMFNVARYCVRQKADSKDVGNVDWNPASESLDTLSGMPHVAFGKTPGDDRLFLERKGTRLGPARLFHQQGFSPSGHCSGTYISTPICSGALAQLFFGSVFDCEFCLW